jgi:hypothetical protein
VTRRCRNREKNNDGTGNRETLFEALDMAMAIVIYLAMGSD